MVLQDTAMHPKLLVLDSVSGAVSPILGGQQHNQGNHRREYGARMFCSILPYQQF